MFNIRFQTLEKLCKNNKYCNQKDFYSYWNYLESIISVFGKDKKQLVDTLIKFEKLYRKEAKLSGHEVYDEILLRSLTQEFPVYYIDPFLFDWLLLSEYPTEIPLKNLFVPDAILLFPKNNSIGIMSCAITSTYYDSIRTEKHDPNGVLLPPNITLEKEDATFIYTAFFDKAGFGKSLRQTGRWGTDIRAYEHKKKTNMGGVIEFLTEQPVNGQSDKTFYQLNRLIAQIFLYMSAYKEDGMKVTNESYGNGVGFKQGKSKLLTPPTIGFSEKEYVENQHKLVSSPNPNLQGIKKQTHWRRGHWRQYDDGKLTWVRPCLINPIAD